jgi:hypothetical protein
MSLFALLQLLSCAAIGVLVDGLVMNTRRGRDIAEFVKDGKNLLFRKGFSP